MTKTEIGYCTQGYALPSGFTWERVSEERARYGIDEIYVPVAAAPGCVAWGVPMMDDKFMSHP